MRFNLNTLRQMLQRRQNGPISSADNLIDAAETYAARTPQPHHRAALLAATRLMRRIDQLVVQFTSDLSRAGQARLPHNPPTTA